MKRIIFWGWMVMFISGLLACTSIQQTPGPALERSAKWVLLPMVNHTDVPQAGLRAESIVENLLLNRQLKVLHYPSSLASDDIFDPTERKLVEEAKKWAITQGARYAVTGTVDEWRYKVGVDGEPAVGVTLQVIDLSNDNVVWSGVGAKSGWSREALSAVAQKLIQDLLAGIQLI